METVNWPGVIERNREALLRIAAMLFAMAGIAEGETAATLPRRLRNALNRILRPTEAAARRLIVIAARGVEVPPLRPRKAGDLSKGAASAGSHVGAPKTLPLVDPLKRFCLEPPRRRARSFPRISIIGVTEPRPVPDAPVPTPDDEIDATRLCRRLAALKHALDDLPAQARRLARWKARRDAGRVKRFSPMRPGWPPGFRKRPAHEIDYLLRDLHSLARHAWNTS